MRRAVFILVACCAVSVLSLAEDKMNSKPSASVSPAKAFNTSVAPSPNITTTIPAKPTHATPNATTTTIHTASTTINTTSTTIHTPTTKTTAAPPAPGPTPSTNLTVGNYSVTKDKKICLIAQMALQIRLESPQANGTFIVQPKMTAAQGGCKETTANLTLVFKEGFITFMFNKSEADGTVYVNALSLVLSYTFNKGANEHYDAKNDSVHLFAAKVGHSYSCRSESLYLGKGLYLDVNQDRVQAFNLTKNDDFGFPDHCLADQPDYRVAIGVGITLLVLIIIVVVAYIVSRRRRTDGYQTL